MKKGEGRVEKERDGIIDREGEREREHILYRKFRSSSKAGQGGRASEVFMLQIF